MRPLLLSMFVLVSCQAAGAPIADGNAEYELLVALGSDAREAVAALCPAGPAGSPPPVALRYGIARVARRLGPRQLAIEVQGRAARGGEGGEKIDPEARCAGLVDARFSRQKGQWFVDELRVERRATAGP